MKKLYLIAQRLRQYYRNNKFIFVLFLFGTVLNAIMTSYLYGNLLPSIYNRRSKEATMYRTYQLSMSSAELQPDEKYKKIDELIETGLFDTVILRALFGPFSNESLNTVYYGTYPLTVLKGERGSLQDREIAVPKPYSAYNLNDIININGEDFKVVAEHGNDGFFISRDSYLQLIDKTSGTAGDPVTVRLELITHDRYVESDDVAVRAFEDILPGAFYARPHGDFYDYIGTSVGRRQLLVSFVVSAVSFAFLFGFMIESAMKENTVSRVVGATRTGLSALVFCEGIVLTSFSTIAGLLIHWFLSPTLFSRLNLVGGLVYELTDYLCIFAVIFTLNTLIMLYYTLKYSRVAPVEARRIAK